MDTCGFITTYYEKCGGRWCSCEIQCKEEKMIKKVYFQNGGKKEGEYKEYYKDGQLKEICYYINGKIHGEYKSYHPKWKTMDDV